MDSYRLSRPSTESEWTLYHTIRRTVLWEARGHHGVYNANHPDEYVVGNHPMLLFHDGQAVGVVRVDLKSETGEAIFRRVAIQIGEQRKGHGTVLMHLAEEFAIRNGCPNFVANAAPDAVPFYLKIGYRLDPKSPENDVRNPRMVKTGKAITDQAR